MAYNQLDGMRSSPYALVSGDIHVLQRELYSYFHLKLGPKAIILLEN